MTSPDDTARDALGRGMDAHRHGRLAEADALYSEALRARPGEPRALRLRGILARERGDLAASERDLSEAARLDPADPEPLAELGVTRMAAGDLDAAVDDLRAAQARDPGHLKSAANLAALLQYRGHVVEAIALHRRVLGVEPGDVEVRANLARALAEAGRPEDALATCDEGLALAPAHPLLLAARGAVLSDLARYAEAAAALEGAVARYPDDDMAFVNLAHARSRLGDAPAAIAALRGALRANPASGRATADLVSLLVAAGERDQALALAARYLGEHPGECQVLAAQAFALDAPPDFGRLVRVTDIAPPRGFDDVGKLNRALARLVMRDASLLASPLGKATRGGSQTGELDCRRQPALAALREVIAAEVAGIAGAPQWTLRAWGTVLEAGGRQTPHIHPLGWLSGVYYVEVPAQMEGSGELEFGRPPERWLVASPASTHVVAPRPGRLVLFPSHLHHCTRPFTAAGRRISIAFDLVPRR